MRNRFVLLADVALFALSAFGAFALRFEWRFYEFRPEFLPFLALVVLAKPAIFMGFGIYRRYWQYASLEDLQALVAAVSAASLAMAAVVAGALVWDPTLQFSRAVLLIDGLLTLCATAGLRVSMRVICEAPWRSASRPGAGPQKRVLVVGAGSAGTLVVREMRRNPHLCMTAVGFLDDDERKVGKRIGGIPVLGTTSSLAASVAAHHIAEIVIAMPTASGATLRAVVERSRQAGIEARTMPGMYELLDGNLSVSRLRKVEISDLLRRPQVVGSPLIEHLTGRTVLITGAGGSIGSELCRQVACAQPSLLVLLGHGENSIFDSQKQLEATFPQLALQTIIADIRDHTRIARLFDRVKPSVVFHAAAHKHVPLMEDNPEEAVANNVFGTQNLVRVALATGVERFVLISSDKAVSPSSIMGATKRIAEDVVREAARQSGRAYVVVRFGNVLGSRGSVVPTLKRQIEAGGPLTITHPEMKRYFMTIPEAVHLVLKAAGMGRGGELFVLNMGEPVRIVDLAQDLVRLSGLDPAAIEIRFTGMRPGEKLEEALWEADGRVEPTDDPEILRVEESPAFCESLAVTLTTLARAVRRGDRTAIETAIARRVPTFAPPPVGAVGLLPGQTLA